MKIYKFDKYFRKCILLRKFAWNYFFNWIVSILSYFKCISLILWILN